jgi:hypothetical protein
VKATIVNDTVKITKDGVRYTITGIIPEGLHVAQDATQLAVFGTVAMLDVNWFGASFAQWRTEKEKRIMDHPRNNL